MYNTKKALHVILIVKLIAYATYLYIINVSFLIRLYPENKEYTYQRKSYLMFSNNNLE